MQLPDGELLTLGQAARRLEIGEQTVRRWADTGRLAVIRLSDSSRVFPRAAVEKLARERAAQAEATEEGAR